MLHRVGVRRTLGPVQATGRVQQLPRALRPGRETRRHGAERLLHERQVLEVLMGREEELTA